MRRIGFGWLATLLFLTAAMITRGQEQERWPAAIYTADVPPATPALEELPLAGKISRHGITWTFAAPARAGRFVNGDWYVVGPVTVVDIEPRPLWGEAVGPRINQGSVREDDYPGRQARNGSVLNPPVTGRGGGYNKGGYDSRLPSDRYDPALFAHLPIEMKPGDTLVSTISRPNDQITSFSGQHVQPLQVAATLTCVANPLPPDAFRPSYTDTANSPIFLARNLRRNRLSALPRPDSAPADLAAYAAAMQKPWLDTVCFGFAAPRDNLPRYGQQLVERVGETSLLLLLDYPPVEKEPLLVNFVQVGIDFWGLARAGYQWYAHGGLYSGRKWPILFAGLMLGDERMQSPEKFAPTVVFHEDDQTAFAPFRYGDETFAASWSGARAIFRGHSPRAMGKKGDRHWNDGRGPLDVYPPSEWPARPNSYPASEGYRRSNTSSAWVAEALAARILRAERVWNHDAFFAYVDRWMTEDDTRQVEAMKSAGFRDFTGAPPGEWPRQGAISGTGRAWVRTLWNAYRNRLPPPPPGVEAPPTPKADETWK